MQKPTLTIGNKLKDYTSLFTSHSPKFKRFFFFFAIFFTLCFEESGLFLSKIDWCTSNTFSRFLASLATSLQCFSVTERLLNSNNTKILNMQTQGVATKIKKRKFLRSTKWNASLILLRDYAELVCLCKVMFWKTHIPVRTQKWPPRLIFAGACHGIVINYVTVLLLTMVTASNLVR